jgi:hypothetical protein
MTEIQKKKRIEFLLERNKEFFKQVFELSKSYEDSEGFMLSKEQWDEVAVRDEAGKYVTKDKVFKKIDRRIKQLSK